MTDIIKFRENVLKENDNYRKTDDTDQLEWLRIVKEYENIIVEKYCSSTSFAEQLLKHLFPLLFSQSDSHDKTA